MPETNYLGGKKTSEIFGVHQRTLYQWEKKGWIKTIRTMGGKRLYDINSYARGEKIASKEDNKLDICYVRVSSQGQKDDLERQIKYMEKRYPKHVIIKDIGSGINMNRKGLNKIIDWAIEGRIREVVVAYKDRLARFGYSQIERIIAKYSQGRIKIKDKEYYDIFIYIISTIFLVFLYCEYQEISRNKYTSIYPNLYD